MTLGIVVFGAAFLVGLGLGTYTRRPLSTAFLVLGSFTALLVLSATGEVLSAAAILVIVALVGLVAESMRETFALLVGRYSRARQASPLHCARAGVAELADATGLGPVELRLLEVRVLPPASAEKSGSLTRRTFRRARTGRGETARCRGASRRRARGRRGSLRRPSRTCSRVPRSRRRRPLPRHPGGGR